MYSDSKEIVLISNMSLQATGLTKAGLEELWAGRTPAAKVAAEAPSPKTPVLNMDDNQYQHLKPPLYDNDSIIAYADGYPSEAFGAPYKPFDHDRVIARLPRDPYKFLDQVVTIQGCDAFVMKAGGQIEAHNTQFLLMRGISQIIAAQKCRFLYY